MNTFPVTTKYFPHVKVKVTTLQLTIHPCVSYFEYRFGVTFAMCGTYFAW